MLQVSEIDHRKIGKELDLFQMSNNIGSGLVLWTPKGGRIRTLIEDFWRKEHYKNGYEVIFTPHIGKASLWETSGHLSFYKDGMYAPIKIEDEEYYTKPMNCPFHIEVYKSQSHSYREFPIRYCELGTVYRYEKSGCLHGLMRVRGFTQDDAHIFCRVDQLTKEIENVLNFSFYMLKSFGFKEFNIKLSTRPEKEYVGSLEIWDKAEKDLVEVLNSSNMPYTINKGDGAFYGPKIDIAVKDSNNKEWQLSTIQLDFNLPERFDLSYVDKEGKNQRPIMIHRALLGSLERFFGILIEHYQGAFPVGLSPVQVEIIPVGEDEIEFCQNLALKLKGEDIRVNVNTSSDTLNYRIREAALTKSPYIAVIGKKEIANGTLSIKKRGDNKSENISLDDFISKIKKESILNIAG